MRDLTRRTFLMTAGEMAAAATTRRAVAAPSEQIRMAVIGARNRGPQVAEAAHKTGQFRIITLADCDDAMYEEGAKTLEEKTGAKPAFQKDFRHVLENKDVDAVVIATPDHWHAMMTDLALQAGKHVYLEKPASYNIADGKAMVAAAQKHPAQTLLVGTQQRSAAHFSEAKEFIKSGGLGKIGFARAWCTHDRGVLDAKPDSAPPKTLDYDMWLGPAPQRPYNENRVHYVWRFIRDYGTGEMGNWGAHWIDTVLWLLDLGYPTGVMGIGGQYVVKDAKDWPDTQTAIYEYPEFSLLWELRLWTDFSVNGAGTGAQVDGEKGSIVITRKGWTFFPKEADKQEHPATNDMELAHLENFAKSIRGEAKPIAPIEDGHKTATLCHLGNIVADLGRRVKFDGETQSIIDDPEGIAKQSREYRAPWKL